MSDDPRRHDPLWEPGSAPDAELERIESALRSFAYTPGRDALEAKLAAPARRAVPWRWYAAAAAFVAVFGIAAAWWVTARAAGWTIAHAEGAVRLGAGATLARALRAGDLLETGAGRVLFRVGPLGEVEMGGHSRVRILRTAPLDQRLALDRGHIRARINAPPRLFVVETPSARAIDLGCAYTLQVDDEGHGRLEVTHGWVSLEAQGRESYIPAGAGCLTRRGYAPGTPYFLDAPPDLVAALARVDFDEDRAGRLAARVRVAELARPRDTLTLWHLLARGSEQERALAYDKLAQLMTVPQAVTRQAVLELDRTALHDLWRALQLGPTPWWRLWRAPAPPR